MKIMLEVSLILIDPAVFICASLNLHFTMSIQEIYNCISIKKKKSLTCTMNLYLTWKFHLKYNYISIPGYRENCLLNLWKTKVHTPYTNCKFLESTLWNADSSLHKWRLQGLWGSCSESKIYIIRLQWGKWKTIIIQRTSKQAGKVLKHSYNFIH
jgi:hypothetical protein